MVNEKAIVDFIKNAVAEDIGDGDHTSLATIPLNTNGKARLIIKEDGILAGVELAVAIFNYIDKELVVKLLKHDGDAVKVGDIALTVRGNTHAILLAERLVLNCVQRMSGIATKTSHIIALLKGTHTKVLDTRKTTPGLRYLEKWAVKIGGGVNHRMGLYDMILIKDNHVDYAGGIENAINAAKKYLVDNRKQLKIEVEVRNLTELEEVLSVGGINRIMLDNFNFKDLKEAVVLINGKYKTEASGGITEDTVRQYADCGVDFISIGALTHSVKSLDMSLKAF
ncbi:MAG: carboxylating nicotinate-nucleotide diphosphorylase [Pedobacter sp.]|nr:carboxylating nicotinate-nucleotide diphosphorylase [Pedobacter sp.]